MNDLLQFKKEIYKYTFLIAVLIGIVSIPIVGIIGIGTEFAYGICLGTLVAVTNFSIMSFAYSLMIETRKPLISMAAYVIRLILAAAAVIVALNIGMPSAMGAFAGLLTVKLAIFYLYTIKKNKNIRR